MYAENIENEYSRMIHESETIWEKCSNIGSFVGLPAGYSKIGISMGVFYQPDDTLSSFIDLLTLIASSDPALTLVSKAYAHFTFLALTGHYWNDITELPPETADLKSIIHMPFEDLSWTLEDLRIIPGNNFLLLAGIPNNQSYLARLKLARDLKESIWKKHILQRYGDRGLPFPPVIWHTTLCRYQYEFFPQTVREVFRQFKGHNFGSIALGKPQPRAVNYDWTISSLIF